MAVARDKQEARGRRLCGARNRSGGRCGRPAGWGTDHPGSGNCKLHGGSSPNGRKHAAKEETERLLFDLGDHVAADVSPDEAISLVLSSARSVHEMIERALRRDDLSLAESKWLLSLFGDFSDRVARIAKTAVDSGIAERQVSLAETHSARLAAMVDVLLDGFGLRDHPDAPEVVKRAFLELEAGGGM